MTEQPLRQAMTEQHLAYHKMPRFFWTIPVNSAAVGCIGVGLYSFDTVGKILYVCIYSDCPKQLHQAFTSAKKRPSSAPGRPAKKVGTSHPQHRGTFRRFAPRGLGVLFGRVASELNVLAPQNVRGVAILGFWST